LVERAELAEQSHEDRHQSSAPQATVTGRLGFGRHGAGERDPASRAEERFLAAVAERLDEAAAAGAFEHLVLIAPPAALGVLRAGLRPATARRIEACDPHERHLEDANALRSRLRDLRAAA
jgi:protein required for attachment to host cells